MPNLLDFFYKALFDVALRETFLAEVKNTNVSDKQLSNWLAREGFKIDEAECKKLRAINEAHESVHGFGAPLPLY